MREIFQDVTLGVAVALLITFLLPDEAVSRTQRIEKQFTTGNTSTVTIDDNQVQMRPCKARYLEPPTALSQDAIKMPSICYEVPSRVIRDALSHMYGGQYVERGKRWVPYYVNDSDREILSPGSAIFQIAGPGGTGFVRTTDEVTGEESQRVRFLDYCIFSKEMNKAICGHSDDLRLSKPNANKLRYALSLLKTMSFADYVPPVGEVKNND